MQKNRKLVKDITFPALGIALFVALSMCLRVPVFDNYYLCLGYVVMTVYVWCFKWYEGALVGSLGVVMYCIAGSLGFNGMPGWALGNVVIGLLLRLGIDMTMLRTAKGKKMNNVIRTIIVAIIAVIATFIGIEIVKSFVDMFVTGQPFALRFAKNFTSFVADAFVIVVS